MIVTIDGPAGAGKSTVARLLARRLGWPFLDTGAMYRAVGLRCLRNGVDLEDDAAVLDQARAADIRLDNDPTTARVWLDGAEVTEAVRSLEVSRATSCVARKEAVRDVLVQKQRQIGAALGTLVTEGRDQGSVVFPTAEMKIVLDATLDRRARRRFEELIADGQSVEFEVVLEDVRQRDENDSPRWAPLLVPGQAVQIDTTEMTLEQVVDALVKRIQQAMPAQTKTP